ncbi:MAG: hypothetical protein M3Z41_07535 [Candidatus Eremiobacteraeota bacterium]|nr:hypothetical protein [Candidatus Eremiobacteraeota bacterium]
MASVTELKIVFAEIDTVENREDLEKLPGEIFGPREGSLTLATSYCLPDSRREPLITYLTTYEPLINVN